LRLILPRRSARILAGLLAKWCLPRSLAEASSRLHSRLPNTHIVFRGIPDKFEEPIVFSFFVNHHGAFVDLAPYPNDVATDDARGVRKRA